MRIQCVSAKQDNEVCVCTKQENKCACVQQRPAVLALMLMACCSSNVWRTEVGMQLAMLLMPSASACNERQMTAPYVRHFTQLLHPVQAAVL